MFRKSYLFLFLIIIIIFTTHNFLNPLGENSKPAQNEDYIFKTENINKNNTSSAFKAEANGKFFIHTGEKKPSIGIFTFKNDGVYIFNFTIRESGKHGDIEFTVLKNNKVIKKEIATINKTFKVKVKIKKDDTIKIIADKHGFTVYDHGNLQLAQQKIAFELKNFLIPFLWSLFFIFLVGKKHTYIAMNAYIIFVLVLLSEKLNFGFLGFEATLIYMLFIFSISFLFILFYQELTRLKRFKLAFLFSFITTFIIYLVPLFSIIYVFNFDHKLAKEIIYAILQTNSKETYEYVSDFISIEYIVLFIFITLLSAILLYRQEKKETERIEKSLLIFIIIIFFSISITQFKQLSLPKFVIDSFNTYTQELSDFRKVQDKLKSGEIVFQATKKQQGETYVVIIGESLNKRHMSLYGYQRNTTPLLNKLYQENKIIRYDNIYSSYPQTMPALSLALTEANQYNNKTFFNSLSIINVFNRAKIETYWLTNQSLYGAWDNLVSIIAHQTDHLIGINHTIGGNLATQEYDGALIKKLKKVLELKTNKTRVIFVHMIGNHAPYYIRYPHKDYARFTEKLKRGEFGIALSKNKYINEYDNSVFYQDYVITSILEELQKTKGSRGFIYLPDHGEDVIRAIGHNAHPNVFTYEMIEIPMIAWFSDEYKLKYSKKYKIFQKHNKTLFSNDMLYDTLIGITGVDTKRYSKQYDLTSEQYSLDDKKALVLHGRMHYTDKSNYIYWQKHNAQYLVDINQSNRIFPNNINTLGKVHEILKDGIKSLTIDTLYTSNANYSILFPDNNVIGMDLEDFLDSIDTQNIIKIMLNIHKLDKYNLSKSLARLEYLDTLFNLKNKTILVLDIASPFIGIFHKAGWHISYRIPTSHNHSNSHSGNEVNNFTRTIAKKIEDNNVSNISFNSSMYSFVKQNLESLINKSIVYHIEDTTSLSKPDFIEKIKNKKFYLDKKVITIMVPYKSMFN